MRKVVTPEFGERLKKARKALKISQKDFAESIGLVPSYLCEIEAGKIKPGFDFFERLTEKYNVNPYYLFHNKPPVLLDRSSLEEEWPHPEDFGNMRRMVHKLNWYLANSSMVCLGILSQFESFMIEHGPIIKKSLDSEGKNYPLEKEQE